MPTLHTASSSGTVSMATSWCFCTCCSGTRRERATSGERREGPTASGERSAWTCGHKPSPRYSLTSSADHSLNSFTGCLLIIHLTLSLAACQQGRVSLTSLTPASVSLPIKADTHIPNHDCMKEDGTNVTVVSKARLRSLGLKSDDAPSVLPWLVGEVAL